MLFSFIKRIGALWLHKRLWRQSNRHNDTCAINLFDRKSVSVGKYTYGPLNIYGWNHPDERLIIGNYVSIASNVDFILGGNHHVSGVTTFPFSAKKNMNRHIDAMTKGTILIEDDVWIGSNVTILSGVSVARGAVIAAGSVVVKNVPAYSIVGGNPAKIIKYRLTPDEIEVASLIDFSLLNFEQIKNEDVDLFYISPTLECVRKIKDLESV